MSKNCLKCKYNNLGEAFKQSHCNNCELIKNNNNKAMKLVEKYPILGSSSDPEKLSLTVKSVGLALIPLIIAIGRMFGLDIVENDLIQLINALAALASCIGVIVGVTRKYLK